MVSFSLSSKGTFTGQARWPTMPQRVNETFFREEITSTEKLTET